MKFEINIQKRYDENRYDVTIENESVCISGCVMEAFGNYRFEPSWFLDAESEAYWDDNWELLEDMIIEYMEF